MGTTSLPDIYALARGLQTQGQVCIYQAKHECLIILASIKEKLHLLISNLNAVGVTALVIKICSSTNWLELLCAYGLTIVDQYVS